MTSVNFYILPDDQLSSLLNYACKIAEENWRSGKRVLIQTNSADDSKQLDDLLWSLRRDSFIPHGVATLEVSDKQQPILLSHQKINDTDFQHVINLSSRPSDINNEQTESTELIIDELLNQNEQRKQSGRLHYKTYRELGYSLKHHTLESIHG